MESNGVEGRIMVSETTKSMIDRAEKNPFIFEKIKVKFILYFRKLIYQSLECRTMDTLLVHKLTKF